jgi:hypothetical protein
MEERIRVLLQQARHAEEANSSHGDEVGGQLEHPEHSSAIEKGPGDVADAFDADALHEASKVSCWRLIEWAHKVTLIIQD